MRTKKMNAKLASVIASMALCVAIVATSIACAFTVGHNVAYAGDVSNVVTLTNVAEMAQITMKSYNNGGYYDGSVEIPSSIWGCVEYELQCFFMHEDYNGPIGIVKGVVNSGKKKTSVYFVFLSGTELLWDDETGLQSTGIFTDMLAGFNINNPYAKAVVEAIQENIPSKSNIMLFGHSLGGMVAQQVAANSKIKKSYKVLNTVTFGAPLISWGLREGTVKRMCDKHDVVPALSVYTLTPAILAQFFGKERNVENAGYSALQVIDAHMLSYINESVWGKYDVLGQKNGKATASFNLDEIEYYKAPANLFA